ncbi:MAG: AzlD domain-containing protein [Eubacteriaceae bacterium]|nr:AzlD domain-containing protein [Eubacteriaceae bacterium]
MSKILSAVFIMAVVTYAIRVIPIAIFEKKIKSRFIKSFLLYTPFAVLGAMTFPGILYSTGNVYYSLAGTLAALILAYFEQGLLKVALGAVFTVSLCMVLLQ